MEEDVKQEFSQEEGTNHIEINMDGIAGNEDPDYKCNLEIYRNLSSDECNKDVVNKENDCSMKIKTEPLDTTECEDGHALKTWDFPETNSIRIKTEIEEIKKEPNEDFEGLSNYNSNDNHGVCKSIQDANLATHSMIIKKENDLSDSSDESDYFIENCTKTEDTSDYLNEVESNIFDQQHGYAYIKEEIEFEDHCIKSEPLDEFKRGIPETDNKPLFKCNFCDYKTRTKNSLRMHSTLHEDPSKLVWYYCVKCNYKTRQKCHLRRHDLVHQHLNDTDLFICATCGHKFKQKSTLKRHINDVHSPLKGKEGSQSTEDSQELKCTQCSYSTLKRSLLLCHLDKHKDTNDISNLYICDVCSFSTKYRRNLREHLVTHKESEELPVYACIICRFQTRMAKCLKRHFLSKKHLRKVGKLEEYCPRGIKIKKEKDF